MPTTSGELALTIAAMFTGAALYVVTSEQRARLQLDDRALLTEFKPSYKHGAMLQAPLALLGCALGLVAWRQTGNGRFLIGALAILAPWPWTLLVIRPVNRALLSTPIADAGPPTRDLIVRWGHLHLGRLTLGAIATTLFVFANLF